MLDPDRSDPAATGQSGRGSALFKHAFEHGIRPARHGKSVGEDHDRRCGSFYADRVNAGSAGVHGIAIGVAIGPGRASGEPESDANTGGTSGTGDVTGSARRVTRGESVISWL